MALLQLSQRGVYLSLDGTSQTQVVLAHQSTSLSSTACRSSLDEQPPSLDGCLSPKLSSLGGTRLPSPAALEHSQDARVDSLARRHDALVERRDLRVERWASLANPTASALCR